MQTLNVPETDGGIIRATNEVTIHERTPCKAIALSLVPHKPEVRVAMGVCGLGGVLAVVKDIHLCTDCLGGNEEGVLGHVTCSINLTLVIDLLHNLYLACSQDEQQLSQAAQQLCCILLALRLAELRLKTT